MPVPVDKGLLKRKENDIKNHTSSLDITVNLKLFICPFTRKSNIDSPSHTNPRPKKGSDITCEIKSNDLLVL